jgi:beta-lactamase class A
MQRTVTPIRFVVAFVLAVTATLTSAPGVFATEASDLAAEITAYTDTLESDYTVSVRELGDGGVTVGVDEHRRVEPASVIKLFYAWAALRRVDLGSLRLSQTMGNGLTWDRCLTLMITISDNKCSADIRVALGNRTLNTLFAASGYPNTYISLTAAGAYKTKRTSAADTSLLLSRLEAGTLLSPASTAYFHQLLKDQVWRTRINLGVPVGVRVENKGGELWVSTGWTQSDAAIVRGPRSTYVLAIYGRNEASKSAVAEISRIVYEALQGEPVTTPASFSSYQFVSAKAISVRATPGGRVLYAVPAGTKLKAYVSDRNWVEVKQSGHSRGWVTFTQLRLRDQYRWL